LLMISQHINFVHASYFSDHHYLRAPGWSW
jgi:hypothetical protein